MAPPEWPKQVRFLLMPHTHWDREWYLPFESFRYRLVRLFDHLIHILESDPSYRSFHMDGQSIVLDDYRQIKGKSERLERLLGEGRVRVGPWYVLPDEFLVGGEALIRNLERGRQTCLRHGARPVNAGYLPDMFGHVAQMPQILAGFGMDTAMVWRGTPRKAGESFTWRGPDGSEVFAKYLPQGYGFASNLPSPPELMRERLSDLVSAIGVDPARPDFLLMNGSDHVTPSGATPGEIARAIAGIEGASLDFTTLEEYLDSAREAADHPPVVAGELRSSERTLILPGVASARLYLKAMDFRCESGLVRYAEPLSALAGALLGLDNLGFLDYGWRLLLENHPHDSICGCSVDQVHDEMETRYRKIERVIKHVVVDSFSGLLAREFDGGLAVWNPSGTRGPSLIVGEVEGRRRDVLKSMSGEPVQILRTISPERRLMDTVLDRDAALILLGEAVSEDLFGLKLKAANHAVSGDTLEVRLDAGSSPGGADAKAARVAIEQALGDPSIVKVALHVRGLARHEVAVRVPELPGASIASYPLGRAKSHSEPGLDIGPERIENQLVRLQFEPGGTCLVTDKKTGLAVRCLRFLDVGDRGDTYNFDPVPEDSFLCEPEKVSARPLANGPQAARMEIRHRFRVPAGLRSSRDSRTRKRVPLDIATWVTLYRDSPRVDFHTAFENNADDHRLQVAARLPFTIDTVRVESAFGVVEREVVPSRPPERIENPDLITRLLGQEGVYSSSPQKTMALAARDGVGAAFLNRGMAELDVVPLKDATRVALTMARCVGWLSRGDLIMRKGDAGPSLPTPGAQCRRRFEWDYAFLPISGESMVEDALQEAHFFAFPPLLALLGGTGSAKSLSLVTVDNPRVTVCSSRPLEGGGLEIRLMNMTDRDQPFSLGWNPAWRKPELTDLAGRPTAARAVVKGERVEGVAGPWGLVTVRLGAAE